MNEVDFSQLIDCRFPYDNASSAEALIRTAKSISTPAMFMLLEEICRPPKGSTASIEDVSRLIETWRKHIDHALADSMANAARTLASGLSYSAPDSLALLEEIAPHQGFYSALNIAYFVCNDAEGAVEQRADQIRAIWERQT
ncbi:hypothetical protein [Ruegeria halocynthiae]|uniref:hypothetical protein n=1 Tax=Ruegeria halocynthiae TaxID=985054 RepID=UPI000563B2E5|nr:hypothetical protein [Ruegeria halocynthiae]